METDKLSEKEGELFSRIDQRSKELSDSYIAALKKGEIKIDSNGHYYKRKLNELALKQILRPHSFWIQALVAEEVAKGKAKSPEKNKNSKTSSLEKFKVLDSHGDCPKCGKMVKWYTKGSIVKAISVNEGGDNEDIACQYKNGFPEIISFIDCNSGKLVFDNDLREFFNENDVYGKGKRYDCKFSVNTLQGMKNTILAYAKDGMGYGFAGNGSCEVYHKKGENLIYVGKAEHFFDSEGYEIEPKKYLKGKKNVGSISLGLWWYSCADFELLKSRDEKKLEERLNEDFDGAFVINVEPGKYKIKNRHHLCRHNPHKDQIYARIEKV
jgi:hypothetical protein